MPKIRYTAKKFNAEWQSLIDNVNTIIEKFKAQGYDPTLRQVYYQLVAHDLFPELRRWTWTGAKWIRDPNGTKNAEPNYKWLIDVVSDARLDGQIDWDRIQDLNRELRGNSHWDSPEQIVAAVASQYRIDKWEGQPNYVEVWVEKDALRNIVARACGAVDVSYFACKGYTSLSEMWVAAQRFIAKKREGRNPIIFHLGDHDPSGIDMTRDIEERLGIFGADVDVRRIALNMNQVQEFNPPPNPAKMTDPRANGYRDNFGDESWELDALTPDVMNDLITKAVTKVRKAGPWNERVKQETAERKQLEGASTHWDSVVDLVERLEDPADQDDEDESDD